MTKGQFAALTVALGLATMAGAGYIAYASSDTQKPGASAGASLNGATGTPGTGTQAPASQDPGPGGDGGSGATAPASTADGGTGAGSAAPACAGSDITVSSEDGQGAAGHLSMLLVFTNTGTQVCVLRGYPGASLFGPDGKDLLDAQRTLSGYSGGAVGLSTPPRVLLVPGGTASAVLEWSDVPTGSGADGGCAVTKAVSLGVTPPNTKQTTTISVDQPQVCSAFQIHPVLKGIVHTPAS